MSGAVYITFDTDRTLSLAWGGGSSWIEFCDEEDPNFNSISLAAHLIEEHGPSCREFIGEGGLEFVDPPLEDAERVMLKLADNRIESLPEGRIYSPWTKTILEFLERQCDGDPAFWKTMANGHTVSKPYEFNFDFEHDGVVYSIFFTEEAFHLCDGMTEIAKGRGDQFEGNSPLIVAANEVLEQHL